MALVGAVFGLFAQSCFDPLYESGDPLENSWVVCCEAQRLTTCLCNDIATCQGSFAVCADGVCTGGSACGTAGGAGGGSGTGGGSATGGGGGATSDAGTGYDAGTGGGVGGGTGGGAGGGGGFADAGFPDSGIGGGAGGGGGVVDAGLGGGAGGGSGGGGSVVQYEACCISGQVTSCQCPLSGCTGTPFLPCSSGRCVPVGESCR